MASGTSAAAGAIVLPRRRPMAGWWGLLMPYSLIADQLGRDPRWGAMAGGKRSLRDALGWSYVRMMCETASHIDDGYLTREQALACCDGRVAILERLATPMLGRPPMLHQPGQSCGEKNCLDSSPPWVAGYDYRLCGYLKRNPAKAEVDRNKAQKDDARDPRLRALLMERDGPFCRYCRSGPLSEKAGRAIERRKVLQRDHVDPDRPAGKDAENYVTACAGCNEHKGRRTPFEADMVLLDPPSAREVAEWLQRGLRLHERPETTVTITDEPPSDHRRNTVPDGDPDTVPDAVPTTLNGDPACPEAGPDQPDHDQDHRPEGFGSGRVGLPLDGGLLGLGGQPVRGPDAPDIYHGRSRAPEPRAGPP
jgi:hypothetical protein